MEIEAVKTSEDKKWLYKPKYPDHWERYPLYSLATWVNGLAFRDIMFSATGMPVIKITEIKGGISGQTKYTKQNFDESVRVKPGDLLFSWSGQPETSIDASWWLGPEGWLNQHIFRVTPTKNIDRVFFYYLLRYLKPNFIAIARNKQTTGLGHVTKRDLENIEAACPPLPEQRAIARILSSLDDKIELNRKMNATLEAMAQALFKSWFVDFNPVRAKAEGRAPAGMDEETAALFPDGFEEVDGREVPVGWSVGMLSSVADILSGGTPKTSISEYWDGDVPWVTAKDVSNNSGGFIINTERKITDRGVSESSTRWLKKGTTIITARGSVGECALLGRDMTMNQTCYGLRGRDEIGSCFVYLMTINKIQELQQQSYGTIFDTITRKTFNEISVVIPPKELLKQFEDILLPLFQSILKNTEQSRTLTALRDTLLPKLISGEVRVPVDEEDKAIR